MKRSYISLAVLCFCPFLEGWAQSSMEETKLLRFYENLAKRDANHEQSLQVPPKDELDYWNDQENYERQLGKSNFTFYLVYLKSKKEAHQKHIQQCNGLCNHSEVYWDKIGKYMSVSDGFDIFKARSAIAQSTELKK